MCKQHNSTFSIHMCVSAHGSLPTYVGMEKRKWGSCHGKVNPLAVDSMPCCSCSSMFSLSLCFSRILYPSCANVGKGSTGIVYYLYYYCILLHTHTHAKALS